MIQPINSPAGFEAIASYTPEAVKKQLFQADSNQSDSPITAAFNEWSRRLHGVKTLADVNKDNLLEYEKILFLCEHNLIFNLMFHNRYDLLHQLFNETENEQLVESYESTRINTELHLPNNIIQQHQKSPDDPRSAHLWRVLEDFEREKIKFDLWLNLQRALVEVEYLYLIAERNTLHDSSRRLDENIIEPIATEVLLPAPIREMFSNLLKESAEEREIAEAELKNPCKKPNGAVDLERARSSLEKVRNYRNNRREKLERLLKNPTVKTELKQYIANGGTDYFNILKEDDRIVREAQQKNLLERNQKKALLEAKLNQLRSEMKFDQIIDYIKQTLERSKQKLRDKLTPNEQRAFTRVINELAALRQEMKSATTSEAMQSTFNKCHKKLDHFISQIKDIPAIATELEPLNKILLAFAAIAEQEPAIHNVWPEDAPVYTTTAEENDVIEMAIDEPLPPSKPSQVSQQQMRSALQEARKSSVSNREEVINIPEDELEDINEQLDELQEILRDLREVLVNGSAELLNAIEESFNALRVGVEENHIIRESMLNNLTQNIDTLEEQNSELKIVLNIKEKLLGLNEQITDYKDESPSQEARIDPSL